MTKVNATTTKIAALWKDGNNAQAQAATLTRQKFSRAKAKDMLLPAFAKAYKAQTVTDAKSGAVRWALTKGRGSNATMAAKAALNRLLAKAWGKKGGKRKATSAKDKVHAIAKMLARLTAAQFKRAVAEAKEIRAE